MNTKVGYVSEMFGNKFNISVTNASANDLIEANCVLTSSSLIISSPTNQYGVDAGIPSILVTDNNGYPLRLTYAFVPGNGLIADPNNNDRLRMHIDNMSIKTITDTQNVELLKNNENLLNALYVDTKKLISYNASLTTFSRDGIDFLKVNNEDIIDNYSIKSYKRFFTDAINAMASYNDYVNQFPNYSDKLYVDTNTLVDNLYLTTIFQENSYYAYELIKCNDKTAAIYSHEESLRKFNEDDYFKNTGKLSTSYFTKLSLNLENMIDNETISIKEIQYANAIYSENKFKLDTTSENTNPSTTADGWGTTDFATTQMSTNDGLTTNPSANQKTNAKFIKHYKTIGEFNNKTMEYNVTNVGEEISTYKVFKVDTQKLEKANNYRYGVVQLDGKTINTNAATGKIYVATSSLTPASSSSLGVVKVDGNTITSNGGKIMVNTSNLTLASSALPGIVKYDNNTIITNASSQLAVQTSKLNKATATTLGVVRTDGLTVTTDPNGILSVSTSIIDRIKSLEKQVEELKEKYSGLDESVIITYSIYSTNTLKNKISEVVIEGLPGIMTTTNTDKTIKRVINITYSDKEPNKAYTTPALANGSGTDNVTDALIYIKHPDNGNGPLDMYYTIDIIQSTKGLPDESFSFINESNIKLRGLTYIEVDEYGNSITTNPASGTTPPPTTTPEPLSGLPSTLEATTQTNGSRSGGNQKYRKYSWTNLTKSSSSPINNVVHPYKSSMADTYLYPFDISFDLYPLTQEMINSYYNKYYKNLTKKYTYIINLQTIKDEVRSIEGIINAYVIGMSGEKFNENSYIPFTRGIYNLFECLTFNTQDSAASPDNEGYVTIAIEFADNVTPTAEGWQIIDNTDGQIIAPPDANTITYNGRTLHVFNVKSVKQKETQLAVDDINKIHLVALITPCTFNISSNTVSSESPYNDYEDNIYTNNINYNIYNPDYALYDDYEHYSTTDDSRTSEAGEQSTVEISTVPMGINDTRIENTVYYNNYVSIDPLPKTLLYTGETMKLTVSGMPEVYKTNTGFCYWKSSNKEIAEISNDGTVTAKGPHNGSTTVFFTLDFKGIEIPTRKELKDPGTLEPEDTSDDSYYVYVDKYPPHSITTANVTVLPKPDEYTINDLCLPNICKVLISLFETKTKRAIGQFYVSLNISPNKEIAINSTSLTKTIKNMSNITVTKK